MFRKFAYRSGIFAASALLLNSPVFCTNKKTETFIWGNGFYQARPDALLQFQNFTPKKINNLPDNLIQLFFGEYYEAGIDSAGQLYIWQKHALDANFDQNNKDNERQGIRVLQKDIKSVKFTATYIWTLDKNGNVYQWPILKKFNKDGQLIEKSIGEKREVQPLRGTVQLQTGRDHLLALNKSGDVYAMGDDTYGQCGQADTTRNTNPPFTETRIKFPTKVKNLSQVVQISVGENHNLALDRRGNLYGWGSNSNLQISHEQQFSKVANPLICSYKPLQIVKNLQSCKINKIASGSQFNVVVGQNRQTQSYEVYTFGTNLRGQLGINQIRHFNDVVKVEKLSNYVLKIKGKQQKVSVDQIQCGNGHCIALLNIGYIMQWGDNQYGQLGNKKRSSSFGPIILREFVGKKIVGVFAGETNSGVIVQAQDKK